MQGETPESECLAKRIWAIRDDIQILEDLKDEIVAFLKKDLELDDAEDHIWIRDTKSAYFNIVGAWQMLNSCLRQEPEAQIEKAESSLGFLQIAKSALGQSASELTALKSSDVDELEKRWKVAFEKCHESIMRELQHFLPSRPETPPTEIIEKKREKGYTLSCAVCGRIAVVILQDKKTFVYSGITKETMLDLSFAKESFELLDKKDLKGLHEHLSGSIQLEDGIDAYCPACNKIYCSQHYMLEQEWDEGFYDCTYGTCPEGHRRIVDD
jgi:hypothetical protein